MDQRAFSKWRRLKNVRKREDSGDADDALEKEEEEDEEEEEDSVCSSLWRAR